MNYDNPELDDAQLDAGDPELGLLDPADLSDMITHDTPTTYPLPRADMRSMSRRLGHADVTVTSAIYSRLTPPADTPHTPPRGPASGVRSDLIDHNGHPAVDLAISPHPVPSMLTDGRKAGVRPLIRSSFGLREA